ncbi:MAG: hypothetical protein ACRC7R_01565 [Sarcina sp.]
MKLIDKQILYVRVGLNQAIRGLKKDKQSYWREKNYNFLKKKLEELEFQKGVNKFQEVLK